MSGEFAAFRPHYAEMRRRLAQTVIAVLLCSTVAYVCKDTLTAWCMQPIRQLFSNWFFNNDRDRKSVV